PSMCIAAKAAESGASITATLVDHSEQKGSKKTFDVIARDSAGKKIACTVTLNETEIPYNWDDANKTSYTLLFTQEGDNVIVVTAGDASKTYHIIYQKAKSGDPIGYATWSIEATTIGYGFIIEPMRVPIYEGENAAQMLDRILTENGFSYSYTGNLTGGFYISALGPGGVFTHGSSAPFGGGAAFNPLEKLTESSVPAVLMNVLTKEGTSLDTGWGNSRKGPNLGEFDYTYMSGWMYEVNNIFPNVGFADSYLSDGDVLRTCFTLYGYGADLGGGYSMGGGDTTDFYKVADKDTLYRGIGLINSDKQKADLLKDSALKSAYDQANKLAVQLDAPQDAVTTAADALDAASAAAIAARDKAAVDAVDTKIAAIGTVTLSSESAITDARTVYNGLSAELQAKVAHYDTLTVAEKALHDLKTVPVTAKDLTTDVVIILDPTAIPTDTSVAIQQVASEHHLRSFTDNALASFNGRYVAYEIQLTRDGMTVEPNGSLTVRFPVPAGFDTSAIEVVKVLEDGSLKRYDCIVKDGYASFEADSFSIYALVQAESAAQSIQKTAPDTGDAFTAYTGIVMALSFLGIIDQIRRKRYQ
ncbi:MAG: DUF4430 domain-containing protein, partial [Oscillibacter sp.]